MLDLKRKPSRALLILRYDVTMYAAIAILFRHQVIPDANRLNAIFLGAMAATGSDTTARTHYLINDGPDCFHFAVRGDDALDCHVYHGHLIGSMYTDLERCVRSFSITDLLRTPYTTFIIENSPNPFPGTLEASQRVALAVADLIDNHAFALVDLARDRLVAITPATPDSLRSLNSDTAFDGAVALRRIAEDGEPQTDEV